MAVITQRRGGARMAATPIMATIENLASVRLPLAMSQPATGFISRAPMDSNRWVVATSAMLQMISESSGMRTATGVDLIRTPWSLAVSRTAVTLAMAQSCTGKIGAIPQDLSEIADMTGLNRLDRRKMLAN